MQVPPEEADAVTAAVQQMEEALKAEYGLLETGLSITLLPADKAPARTLTEDSAQKVVTLLTSLPHGVVKYSHQVPGLYSSAIFVLKASPAAYAGCSTCSGYTFGDRNGA